LLTIRLLEWQELNLLTGSVRLVSLSVGPLRGLVVTLQNKKPSLEIFRTGFSFFIVKISLT